MAKTKVIDKDMGWRDLVERKLAAASFLELEVGIFEDQHPEIAFYASINEFGAPQANIPERPAWRTSFDANTSKYESMLITGYGHFIKGRMSWRQVLESVGREAVADLKATIIALDKPPNEPSTLEAKATLGQGANPLVATGDMLAAVAFRVTSKGGG